MKLLSMTFSEHDDGIQPDTVTVTMTAREALWIAIVAGQQRGDSPHHDIYCCLTTDVFNRYWDDGVVDAKKEIPFATPPIRYSED